MDEAKEIELGTGFCPNCGAWLEWSCDWESVDDNDICHAWGCQCGEQGTTPYRTNTGDWPENWQGKQEQA